MEQEPRPDQDETKRVKRDDAPAAGGSGPASAVWQPPSAAALYEQGLENKAQAHTAAADWSLNTREWREAGFSQADADGAHLRQKQSEVRRMLLAQQRASQG